MIQIIFTCKSIKDAIKNCWNFDSLNYMLFFKILETNVMHGINKLWVILINNDDFFFFFGK